MAFKALPDAEYLRNRFAYDPETGLLTWKPKEEVSADDKRWNSRHAGTVAGKMMASGIQIGLLGGLFLAHRIIWKMQTGKDPDEIDHIDHSRGNNRWSNLRNVSRGENMKNRGQYANNTSGYPGVSWHKATGKWQAEIYSDGKSKYLGLFQSHREAVIARAKAQDALGFHENHGK
jgi:hypothetical protein